MPLNMDRLGWAPFLRRPTSAMSLFTQLDEYVGDGSPGPRREGPDAALHFLLDVRDWCLRPLERQPLEHPGLFALLNRLGGGPYPLCGPP